MLRERIGVVLLIGLLFSAVMGWNEAKRPGRLPLQDVRLLGASRPEVIRVAGSIEKGVNILGVDLKQIQSRMESIPWVRSAWVKRQFPSTLIIRVVEKVAVAMGREQDQLVLLDEYGAVIKPLEAEDPLVTPIVIPVHAENQAGRVVWLIDLLARNPWFRDRVSEAVELPGGRWTLYTKNGIKILFSKQTDQEMALLKRLQEKYALLDRKIRQVELRIPGKAAVRFAF